MARVAALAARLVDERARVYGVGLSVDAVEMYMAAADGLGDDAEAVAAIDERVDAILRADGEQGASEVGGGEGGDTGN